MVYEFAGLELDLDVHELRRDGTVVPVEPQVFDVLAHLVRHRNRTVTKEELLDAVWGDRFVSESALTSRIKAARRAVGDDGRAQAVIRTVHGRGYRLVAAVTERGPADRTGRADRPAAPRAPRTRYADSDGHAIAYQVVGEGGAGVPDVVFVPGFVSNVELQWEVPEMAGTFADLARGRRLVVFDKRGTGVSERVSLDRLPTLEERMDDVRAVMDAAGVERATVFGISEGGPMAVLLAAAHPERVERLVLFGTYVARPLDPASELIDSTRRYWGSGTAFEFLAPSWAGDHERRRVLARYERLSATPDAAAALVAMADEIDIGPVLAAVNVPTLVVHRTGDGVFAVSGARDLAAGIPGAELVEVPGSDHLLFSDPEPVLRAVTSFLDRTAPEAPAGGSGPTDPPTTVTALTTLVAFAGPEPGEVDPTVVADCLARLGGQPTGGDPRSAGGGPPAERAVSVLGDVVLARVDGPARAVRCAEAVLDRLPVGHRTGAGVHTAEVRLVGDRPEGLGVDIGRAAAAAAGPGRILVTRTVTDLVAGSGLAFTYRGAHDLGGPRGRWELYEPAAPADAPASSATTGSR